MEGDPVLKLEVSGVSLVLGFVLNQTLVQVDLKFDETSVLMIVLNSYGEVHLVPWTNYRTSKVGITAAPFLVLIILVLMVLKILVLM